MPERVKTHKRPQIGLKRTKHEQIDHFEQIEHFEHYKVSYSNSILKIIRQTKTLVSF